MKPTFEQQMRNVASILRQYTEVTRPHNGKGHAPTYAARVDAIAQTGRQLADMVIEYLDKRDSGPFTLLDIPLKQCPACGGSGCADCYFYGQIPF